MSSTPIHLDGTTLEGGGQLLRVALSLSSLTHIPIHVTDIRGKRGPVSSPGKDGGLKPAHLAGAQWLAKATAAHTEGMESRSREMIFRPAGKGVTAASRHSSVEQREGGMNGPHEGVWKHVYESGRLIRSESHIPVSTPGSILLILQATLPYLLFCPSSAVLDHQNHPVPLRVKIDGGTNVSNSPSIDYFSQVFVPVLTKKLGIPQIGTIVHKRGWSTGRTQIGSVSFDVMPLSIGHTLPHFKIEDRGDVVKVHVSIIAPGAKARGVVKDHVIAQLLAFDPEVEILFPIDEDSRNEKRWYLLLVAETSGGCRLGRDWLYDRKTKNIKEEETSANLVSKVVKDLKRELKHGGCVDEHMQDQLVIFQALANCQAVVDAGSQQASLHTQTARWVVEKILGVEFDERGHCDGVRFKIGGDLERQKAKIEEATEELKKLEIEAGI